MTQKAVTRSQCDKHTQLLPTTPFSRPRQVALTASRADLSLHRKLSASPRQGTWDICGKNIKRLNLSPLANLSITFLRLFLWRRQSKKSSKGPFFLDFNWSFLLSHLLAYTRKDGTTVKVSLSSLFLRLLSTISFSIPPNWKCLFYKYS